MAFTQTVTDLLAARKAESERAASIFAEAQRFQAEKLTKKPRRSRRRASLLGLDQDVLGGGIIERPEAEAA